MRRAEGAATGAAAHGAFQALAAAKHRSHGRLLAYLAWRWQDLAAAEDALGEAYAAALAHWPASGIPESPDGWLMAVAKRQLLQAARHARVASDPAALAVLAQDEVAPEAEALPDQRLQLLFVCAHPAIDPSVHTALMLQTVLGVEAKRVAQAFLVSPAGMAQRLVRAKQRIAGAGIRFEAPEAAELPTRTHAVLEAIYAAYGLAWEGSDLNVAERSELADEARFLARLVHQLMPDNAEAAGLLALVTLCDARQAARFGPDGAFIPLHAQDAAHWDQEAIRKADRLLLHASALRQPGPFQLEAAIQAAHCHRAFTGVVPWAAIAQLHGLLRRLSPTLGARVGHAVATAEAGAPADGLRLLDELAQESEGSAWRSYQPYWVARSHLDALLGHTGQAAASLRIALGLTVAPAVRAYLRHTTVTCAGQAFGPCPCPHSPANHRAMPGPPAATMRMCSSRKRPHGSKPGSACMWCWPSSAC